jgi:hypothetical protein
MFLTHTGKKSHAAEEVTISATFLYHQLNQSIHITDGVTVMSLSPSLLQKSVAMDDLCQIVLNQKLSHKFEKWLC